MINVIGLNNRITLHKYTKAAKALHQAQYVMVSHHHSDSSQKKAKQEIADGFNVDMNDSQAVFAAFGNWPQPLIRAKLEHRCPFN